MREDIAKYVQDCGMCSRNKPPNKKKVKLLSPPPIPGISWDRIGVDFITHLPKTNFESKIYSSVYGTRHVDKASAHSASYRHSFSSRHSTAVPKHGFQEPWSAKQHIIRQRCKVYKQVLDSILPLLVGRHQAQHVYSIPFRDRRTDRKRKNALWI